MIVIEFLQWLLGLISGSSFVVPNISQSIQTVSSVISFISYVLPMNVVVPLILISIGTLSVRVIISLLKTVMSIIPFV